MEATRPAETKAKRRSKSRNRKSGKYSKQIREEQQKLVEERLPKPVEETAPPLPTTRDGAPVVTTISPEKASSVQNSFPTTPKGRHRGHERVVLDAPPAAREAAFSGPPRYDWIDIETAAAIKVQSVVRRNKVMAEMDAQGMSTSAIRNRNRRRRARQGMASSDDSPGLFQCCGMGLIFGDATEEDMASAKAYEREQYLEKKRQKAEREYALRQYRPRAKTEQTMSETIEVVE